MIIVEGCDGSGKSQLSRELAGWFGIPIAEKVVSSATVPLVDLRKWVDRNLKAGWQNEIFDRHRLISGPIYDVVMKKAIDPGFWDLTWMTKANRRLNMINPIIIYCIPPRQTVVDNVWADPLNAQIKPFVDQLYTAYVARAAVTPGFIYDYTGRQGNHSWQELTELISDRIWKENHKR